MSTHINQLELLAAFFGLKCFSGNQERCQVLFHIDNTTAVSYKHTMGRVQFENLNKITRLIWNWCEKRRIWIYATYIPSKMSKIVDDESHRLKANTEVELSNLAYDGIVRAFGHPEIDLFASKENVKCSRYVP